MDNSELIDKISQLEDKLNNFKQLEEKRYIFILEILEKHNLLTKDINSVLEEIEQPVKKHLTEAMYNE